MVQAGLRESYALAREQLRRAAERNKHIYDMRVRPVQFPLETWVWFYNARRYVGRTPKLQRNYTGPFLVVKTLTPVTVVIQKSPKANTLVVHTDKLKRFLAEVPRTWLPSIDSWSEDGPPSVIVTPGTPIRTRHRSSCRTRYPQHVVGVHMHRRLVSSICW